MTAQLESLASAGIQIVPSGSASHILVERGGSVAWIEHRNESLRNPGAPGLMTERGFAVLIWRGGQAVFLGKGFEQPASEQQVAALRTFASDLENVAARPE